MHVINSVGLAKSKHASHSCRHPTHMRQGPGVAGIGGTSAGHARRRRLRAESAVLLRLLREPPLSSQLLSLVPSATVKSSHDGVLRLGPALTGSLSTLRHNAAIELHVSSSGCRIKKCPLPRMHDSHQNGMCYKYWKGRVLHSIACYIGAFVSGHACISLSDK